MGSLGERHGILLASILACCVSTLSGCAAVNHNLRVQSLTKPQTDAARLVLLQQDVDAGDQTLGNILRAEGSPDKVEVQRLNPNAGVFELWRVELHLYYPRSRKLYVLQGGENVPWQLVRTGVASSLLVYRQRDTIAGYREYLARFPDDPPEELRSARARLDDLVQGERRSEDIARMEEFVRRQPKPESVEAYEAWLKRIGPDDASRWAAVEKRDALRFEAYKAKGTRAALREFAEKYSESSTAQRLRAEYILDDGAAAALSKALGSLEELQTATSVGLNFQEYSRRLVDAKIGATRALAEGAGRLPAVAVGEINGTIAYYQEALDVWNYKIANVDSSHDYWYRDEDVHILGWLRGCPEAIDQRFRGRWFPDIVIQCRWHDARGQLTKTKARVGVP